MAAQIKILNSDLKALGSTSKAFNIEKTEELMREYILSFSVVNNDSVFKYLNENTVFQYNGQYFDVSGIDGDSGTSNITQITAEHISYRLADYTLPNGYSFVGTVEQIAQDILNEAKTVEEVPASTIFSIGFTADLGTLSFGLAGATNVTARDALIAMSELGVEVSFDNFTVNLPERIGNDNGLIFKYAVNLNGVHRTWQRGNGWSYDVKIADIAKAGQTDAVIGIGDDVTVDDTYSNTVLKSRIISYTECDDPTKNHITIGVFVRDNASMSIETDRIANAANNTANNSVQQGKKYSNVSIDHTDGFKATNRAGTQRVLMNADDCFVVQVKQNDEWVTVNSLEAFGLLINRITSKEAKEDFYITVGQVERNKYGLLFYIDGEKNLSIASADSETVTFSSPKIFKILTSQAIQLESTDDDAISYINSRNFQINTSNLISHNTDTNDWGRAVTGELTLEYLEHDGTKTGIPIQIINGIVTKFGDLLPT